MQLESEARPIAEILRAAIRREHETPVQSASLARRRHELGDEIAALDEHWVFRKR